MVCSPSIGVLVTLSECLLCDLHLLFFGDFEKSLSHGEDFIMAEAQGRVHQIRKSDSGEDIVKLLAKSYELWLRGLVM